MKRVFADTFFYLATLDTRDAAYHRAMEFGTNLKLRIVTTEYVFIELLNSLSSVYFRKGTIAFVRHALLHQKIEVIPASGTLFEKALTLYEQRPDKEWSFTDCASFVVMKERGIKDALTGDLHFQQAGFNPLLRR